MTSLGLAKAKRLKKSNNKKGDEILEKLQQVTSEEWSLVNDFNRNILEDFIINNPELSQKTRRSYESNLRIWFVWVKDYLGNKSQLDIKPLEYKKFQNWMLNRGCSSSDVNNKRAAISSLNSYIEIYYSDDYPLFRNFINKSIKRPPKAYVNEKEPLTKDEFAHLIEVLTERGEWQKIAYLVFTLDTGCRREESRQLLKNVVNANPIKKTKHFVDEDGNMKETTIVYYQTHPIRCKGAGDAGKVRRFAFSEHTMQVLKKWLKFRGEDNCEYMFVTNYGGEVHQVSETLFNTWAKNTFSEIIGRRAYPHQLRASRATQLSQEDGVDVKVIQKLLGHENATTTEIYIQRNDTDDIEELYVNN